MDSWKNDLKTARPSILRRINLSIILKILMKYQPISRTRISQISGISKPTVSKLVSELYSRGFVISVGKSEPKIGKRQELLKLNPDKDFNVVVDIGLKTTRIALVNFSLEIIDSHIIDTPADLDKFIMTTSKSILKILKNYGKLFPHAVVVSVPGPVHSNRRIAIKVPLLHWENVYLADLLELALYKSGVSTKVLLENDANFGVIAEVMLNPNLPMEGENIVYILVKEGIGVGLFLNGMFYYGRSHTAGEFGHMVIDPKGPECSCGRRGCWLTLAGSEQLYRYLRDDALDEYIRIFGIGLVNIINGLDPDVVIISGVITNFWDKIYPKLREIVIKDSLVQDPEALKLVPSIFENGEAPLLGGAVIGFEDYFNVIAHW